MPTKDENELAKSIIDDIIAETESENWEETKIQKIAKLGGLARAAKLSKIRKSEIAKNAAEVGGKDIAATKINNLNNKFFLRSHWCLSRSLLPFYYRAHM